MTTLIFHGYLAGLFPDGRLQVEATSAAEAIAALDGRPGFQRDEGDKHFVSLPDFQSKDALYDPCNPKVIHVMPSLEGEGGKGMVYAQIVIGVVLIATGWGSPVGAELIIGSGISAGTAVMAGALMVLGGIMSLLMPQPTITGSDQANRSNYLPANHNTTAIGTPIPLLIGRRRVYGQFLSFDIDAKDRTVVVTPPPAAAPASPEYSDWVASDATFWNPVT